MPNAYIIEVEDIAVGLVVRDRGGFRFFASDAACAALDSRMFRDARAAEREAERCVQKRT